MFTEALRYRIVGSNVRRLLLGGSILCMPALVSAQLDPVPVWTSPDQVTTRQLSWGDWDGDGDLDLAAAGGSFPLLGPVRVYVNDGTTLRLGWSSTELANHSSVAWGDWDGDGDLDLAAASSYSTPLQPARVYRNDGATMVLAWESTELDEMTRVAWGDHDGDDDLDLAVGSLGFNHVYRNDPGSLSLAWSSPQPRDSRDLAWGDLDGDGDIDLALADEFYNSWWRNDPGGTFVEAWTAVERGDCLAVSLADLDADGGLDLGFSYVGNETASRPMATTYRNLLGTPVLAWSAMTVGRQSGTGLAWGDMDCDHDLDLALTHYTDSLTMPRLNLYAATSGSLPPVGASTGLSGMRPGGPAWGDWDGDGDLDLAIAVDDSIQLLRNVTDPFLRHVATASSAGMAQSVAWGDWDTDGDLDVAVGNRGAPSRVLGNDGGTLAEVWSTPAAAVTNSAAWGDWDGDGDLDLALGNEDRPVEVYRNNGGSMALGWVSPQRDATSSIAWGDWDGDLDLDLATGNAAGPDRLYRNDGGALALAWSSPEADSTRSVAWGDYDADGDLDLACGVDGAPVRIYANRNGTLERAWDAPRSEPTWSVAWADWDADGDLDLAAGGGFVPVRLYRNEGGGVLVDAWRSTDSEAIQSVAWGDGDDDGDLDLLVTGPGTARIYRNDRGTMVLGWTDPAPLATAHAAWGDMEGDGDLDVVEAIGAGGVALLENPRLRDIRGLPETPSFPSMPWRPGVTAAAPSFSSAERVSSPVLMPYRLHDRQGDRVFTIRVEFSDNGGGRWQPATEAPGGEGTLRLSTAPDGARHFFAWDAARDGVVMDDDVVMRITVPFQSPDQVASAIQLGRLSATSPPFRVGPSSCVVGSLSPRTGLLGVKQLPAAASFEWQGESDASGYHLNSVEQKTDLVTPRPHRPPFLGGIGVAQCDAVAPLTKCTDPDALPSPPALLFYQVVSTCGPSGSDEGPI